MVDHLIITVHGIGEHEPGLSVDELTASLRDEFGATGPTRSDELLLNEPRPVVTANADNAENLRAQFPCNIREFEAAGQDGATDRLTIAEVYWSDLSPAPRGVVATLFDLLRLVLGLGYLARDNAEYNGGVAWGAPALINGFLTVIYALIVPLNIILFLGAVLLFFDGRGIEIVGRNSDIFNEIRAAHLLLGLGIVTSLSAAVAYSRTRITPIGRLVTRACFWSGVVISLVAIPGFFMTAGAGSVCNWLPEILQPDLVASSPDSVAEYPNLADNPALDCFVHLTVTLLNFAFLLTCAALAGLVGVGSVAQVGSRLSRDDPAPRKTEPEPKPKDGGILLTMRLQFDKFADMRSIYIAICAAMLVFWVFLTSSLWLAFVEFASTVTSATTEASGNGYLLDEVFDRHFQAATGSLVYVMVSLISALIACGVIYFLRRRLKTLDPKTFTAELPWIGRAILNPVVNILLFFAAIGIALGALTELGLFLSGESLASRAGPDGDGCGAFCWGARFFLFVHEYSLLILPVVGALLYKFADVVAAGLGVARDIIVYARPSDVSRQAGSVFKPGAPRWERLDRTRIHARFQTVLRHFKTRMTPDTTLTIASHSLGTVIAVSALPAYGYPVKQLNLVTMGSPVTHIYKQYFERDIQISDALRRANTTWTNIFRVDDFVGTFVDEAMLNGIEVRNEPILANGHSGYWRDRSATRLIAAKLRSGSEKPRMPEANA